MTTAQKRTEKITIRLPESYTKGLDYLVDMDDFPTRSEAIRTAIRDFVYGRIHLVTDMAKKRQEAETSIAEMEEVRKRYLSK